MSTPNIDPLIRSDLMESLRRRYPSMSAADKRKMVDDLMEMAKTEGRKIRRDRLTDSIHRLRTELHQAGAQGRYPKAKWAKLRRLEASLEVDR